MTRKPAVSFLIPAHNRPELLKAALASCIAQSCDAWEAVVVDDHSETADLQSLVASFNDARLRYTRLEAGEHGVSMGRNRAIELARVDQVLDRGKAVVLISLATPDRAPGPLPLGEKRAPLLLASAIARCGCDLHTGSWGQGCSSISLGRGGRGTSRC